MLWLLLLLAHQRHTSFKSRFNRCSLVVVHIVRFFYLKVYFRTPFSTIKYLFLKTVKTFQLIAHINIKAKQQTLAHTKWVSERTNERDKECVGKSVVAFCPKSRLPKEHVSVCHCTHTERETHTLSRGMFVCSGTTM